MITRDQLMHAIAMAIQDGQDLYIDSYAKSSATPEDFVYLESGEQVDGYTLLLKTRTFISQCIYGESIGEPADDGLICAQDIQNGWDESAPMPTIKQIREYVEACDSNDNFADMIETLENMDVLPHHEGSSLSYTLTLDESEDNGESVAMTCTLTRADGETVGTYKLTNELADDELELWSVEALSGPAWDDVTGMYTDRSRTIECAEDNDELDRCYRRGSIVIRITLPFCIAGLTDVETRALYIAHERQDAVAAAAHMARTAAQPYTLSRSVELLNMLIYIASGEPDAIDRCFVQAYDDEDAARVIHYPARDVVRAEGRNAEEYLRAVSMLSGRTPDDAESDEGTIWNYYNA